MKRIFLFPALLACLAFSPGTFDAYAVSDISVIPASHRVDEHRHGYLDHRVRVSNKSAVRSHTVRLVMEGSYPGGGNTVGQIVKTLVLAPGSTAVVSLFQPPVEMYSGQLKVFTDGSFDQAVSLPSFSSRFTRGGYYGRPGIEKPTILIGRNTNIDDFRGSLTNWFAGTNAVHMTTGRAYAHAPAECFVLVKAEADVAEWSDNWLSYTCYDGLVLKESEIQQMPAAVHLAIRRYATAGGTVLVLGKDEIPVPWKGMVTSRSSGMTSYSFGFGRYLLCDQTDAGTLTSAHIDEFIASCGKSSAPWGSIMNTTEANGVFPVVDNLQMPVRGLFFLMLGFAILIGPANLIFLARKNRRIWMLWTVPAISLATCLIVLLYSLLAEGITPSVRQASVTLLDEELRLATTLGMTAYYCPLTPAGGLRYSCDAEVTPISKEDHWRGDTGGERSVDWTSCQHLNSGWISARVPAFLQVRKSEVRRERLLVTTGADGKLSVVNGLGSTIKTLWVADASGIIHAGKDIAGGKQAVLEKGTKRACGSGANIGQIYENRDWTGLKYLEASPEVYLQPRTYIAVLEDQVFMEHGLDQKVKSRQYQVVFGILPSVDSEKDGAK